MRDQKIGREMGDLVRGWVEWGVKWGVLVVGVGLVDEWMMGGRSGVLGGLWGLWGRIRE